MSKIGSSATDDPFAAEDDQRSAPIRFKKAKMFQVYTRLLKMATRVKDDDDFHCQFLGVARNLLDLLPIQQGSGSTVAVIPDPLEVCEAMSDMLPSPSSVFTVDYFSRPVFPRRVLFNTAEFFTYDGMPDDFLGQVVIRDHERAHESIMSQAWPACVLGLNPSSTRCIIDRFQRARALPTRQTVNVEATSTTHDVNDYAVPGEFLLSRRPQQEPGLARVSRSGPLGTASRYN